MQTIQLSQQFDTSKTQMELSHINSVQTANQYVNGTVLKLQAQTKQKSNLSRICDSENLFHSTNSLSSHFGLGAIPEKVEGCEARIPPITQRGTFGSILNNLRAIGKYTTTANDFIHQRSHLEIKNDVLDIKNTNIIPILSECLCMYHCAHAAGDPNWIKKNDTHPTRPMTNNKIVGKRTRQRKFSSKKTATNMATDAEFELCES